MPQPAPAGHAPARPGQQHRAGAPGTVRTQPVRDRRPRRLNTSTGTLTWTNHGHQPPILIRDGRWSTLLRCPPTHPMGTDLRLPTTVCHEQLQPGDRLVLCTDGITEARTADGREFGLSRFTDFLIRHHADQLPVPEPLRRLMRAVLRHHDDHLRDDAGILVCEWLGPGSHLPSAAPLAGIPGPCGQG
ncbi:PP2C family protein-serine/threonine phosphatase [Streptomyces sp. NPDC006184]|uniref:PP2C family protein-serine/threonine phosphatase n=1 Tax=Streptomyces sp. NPDC006184 TaxID=3155455 RepID=UPI0033BE1336